MTQPQPETLPAHIQARIDELTAKLTHPTAGAKEIVRLAVVREWEESQRESA